MVHLIMYEKEFRKIVDEVLADAETAVRETRSGVLKVREEDRIRVALPRRSWSWKTARRSRSGRENI